MPLCIKVVEHIVRQSMPHCISGTLWSFCSKEFHEIPIGSANRDARYKSSLLCRPEVDFGRPLTDLLPALHNLLLLMTTSMEHDSRTVYLKTFNLPRQLHVFHRKLKSYLPGGPKNIQNLRNYNGMYSLLYGAKFPLAHL